MIRVRMVMPLACCLLALAPAAAAGSLEAVKARYLDTWSDVRAFECTIQIEASDMDGGPSGMPGTMNSTGAMSGLRQNDGVFRWKMNLTMTVAMPELPEPFEARVVTSYDGEFVYTITNMMGQTMVTRSTNPDEASVPVGEEMWNRMAADNTLTYAGEGEVDGVAVDFVRAVANDAANATSDAATYAFRKDNALVIRAEIETGDEAGTVVMTASNYNLAANLEESDFEVELPVGATIIDVD